MTTEKDELYVFLYAGSNRTWNVCKVIDKEPIAKLIVEGKTTKVVSTVSGLTRTEMAAIVNQWNDLA